MSNSAILWTVACQAPLPIKNTGVGCHALSSRGFSQSRDQTRVCYLAGGFFTASSTWQARWLEKLQLYDADWWQKYVYPIMRPAPYQTGLKENFNMLIFPSKQKPFISFCIKTISSSGYSLKCSFILSLKSFTSNSLKTFCQQDELRIITAQLYYKSWP